MSDGPFQALCGRSGGAGGRLRICARCTHRQAAFEPSLRHRGGLSGSLPPKVWNWKSLRFLLLKNVSECRSEALEAHRMKDAQHTQTARAIDHYHAADVRRK